MRRFLIAAVICAPLFAQAPTDVFQKAPPNVDNALRARVARFYQAHVDGKFRQAEALVAEDSKDPFYTFPKKKFLSFEITRINYSENFTKATVVTTIEVEAMFSPRMGKMIIKPPETSQWRIENGEWCWYLNPEAMTEWNSPFGTMHPGPEAGAQTGSKIADALRKVDAKAILNAVKVSKNDILLSSYQDARDSVEIVNGMPGSISLQLENPSYKGLEVKLDKTTLNQGETAHLLASFAPPDKSAKPTTEVVVRVEPTGQALTFRVTFAVPPELQQQLPNGR